MCRTQHVEILQRHILVCFGICHENKLRIPSPLEFHLQIAEKSRENLRIQVLQQWLLYLQLLHVLLHILLLEILQINAMRGNIVVVTAAAGASAA